MQGAHFLEIRGVAETAVGTHDPQGGRRPQQPLIPDRTEVVCRRWTPLILRELLAGSTHFNEIRRGVPNCSPALLSARLKELEAAGVVERRSSGKGSSYNMTESGWELLPLIQGLAVWGQRWVRSDYRPDDLDPGFLLWDVRRYLSPGGLGSGRVVVDSRFRPCPPRVGTSGSSSTSTTWTCASLIPGSKLT